MVGLFYSPEADWLGVFFAGFPAAGTMFAEAKIEKPKGVEEVELRVGHASFDGV